jgi:class 3 adenylate cyclase
MGRPGGICISGTVHEHLGNKLALSYEDLGAQLVKNIAEPVRVFQVLVKHANMKGVSIVQILLSPPVSPRCRCRPFQDEA